MIINLADLKTELNITDTLSDDVLNSIIGGVGLFIETYTGKSFEIQSKEIVVSGDNEEVLFLDELPTLFQGYGTTNFVKIDGKLIPEGDLFMDSAGFIEYLDGVFTKGKRNIEVKYSFGYDEAPDDIKLVAMNMAKFKYNLNNSDDGSSAGGRAVKSEKAGDITVTYENITSNLGAGGTGVEGLSVGDKLILDKYKNNFLTAQI